jgi:hypothetical protein
MTKPGTGPLRYEVPPGLRPEEERAIRAALDVYFGSDSARPSAWSLQGRAEGVGLGALQIRNQSRHPWGEIGFNAYTRLGIESRVGRGDSK